MSNIFDFDDNENELAPSIFDNISALRPEPNFVDGLNPEQKQAVLKTEGPLLVLAGAAEPMDATALLGTDELITHQNKLVSFKGLTVKSVSYKNDEPGDDIYLTLTLNGADYEFCVERYLTDPETEVYKTVGTLEAGDVVDVEGFLYWYNGSNPHITKITVAE